MHVNIYQGDALIGCSTARYLSLWGMVLVEGPVHFPPRTRLNIEISLSEGKTNWRCRVPAIVARYSRMGIGLVFENPNPDIQATLRSIIFRSWKQMRNTGKCNPVLGPSAIAWPASFTPVEPGTRKAVRNEVA